MKREQGTDLGIDVAAVDALAERMERELEGTEEPAVRWTDAYRASGGKPQPPGTLDR